MNLPESVQKQIFEELLDQNAQNELEHIEPCINWCDWLDRLYALWNRSQGDCLLDSLLQATWGIFDLDNTLRKALAHSLADCSQVLSARWKDYESQLMLSSGMPFALDEGQWQRDWSTIQRLANQAGASLEQIHVFTLAHILRRPIIVYGVKYVRSFRGELLGFAGFQGIYLPLLWEQSYCWRNPVVLGFTRGHFSALVCMQNDREMGASARANTAPDCAYLPLVDSDRKLLPIHYAPPTQDPERLLNTWLDCNNINGLLVARQRHVKRPISVYRMLDEWMQRYRQLALDCSFALPYPS